jgi:chromatin remodeling complex protein RSC6
MPSEKKSKKGSKKQSVGSEQLKEEVVQPVSAPAPTPAPVQESAPESAPESSKEQNTILTVEERFANLTSKIQSVLLQLKGTQTDLKQLNKEVTKELNQRRKKGKKRVVDPNREPSGFAKKTIVTNQLLKFLGHQENTLMSRTEVTKGISVYVKQHDLQNPKNRREIVPNAALRKLLSVPPSETLTFFNLQKYLKVHFPKKTETETETETLKS